MRVAASIALSVLLIGSAVPGTMEGCHTILVEGYVVEGHVSAEITKRLLSERPAGVRGISIPGMPTGSARNARAEGSSDRRVCVWGGQTHGVCQTGLRTKPRPFDRSSASVSHVLRS